MYVKVHMHVCMHVKMYTLKLHCSSAHGAWTVVCTICWMERGLWDIWWQLWGSSSRSLALHQNKIKMKINRPSLEALEMVCLFPSQTRSSVLYQQTTYPYGRDTKLFSTGLFQELLGELNGYLNVALCIPQLMISVLGGSLISLATLLKQW